MEISNYEGRNLIGYKIAGSKQSNYISENHFRQRIVNAEEDLEKNQTERLMKDLEKEEK